MFSLDQMGIGIYTPLSRIMDREPFISRSERNYVSLSFLLFTIVVSTGQRKSATISRGLLGSLTGLETDEPKNKFSG